LSTCRIERDIRVWYDPFLKMFDDNHSSTMSERSYGDNSTTITRDDEHLYAGSEYQSAFDGHIHGGHHALDTTHVESYDQHHHNVRNGHDEYDYRAYDTEDYNNSSNSNNRHSDGVEDATKTIHEMHYALLYLMSNPEEFAEVVRRERLDPDHNSLSEWQQQNNDDDDDDEDDVASKTNASNIKRENLLPYVVFAPDAEVVLPQAHTASQLFGIEQIDGIELEAAAGIVPLSQLFLRWLALMPGGDHCNIIDPPGLTVMRIAGGRYRVTAAHRAVWTWNNYFLPEVLEDDANNNALRTSAAESISSTVSIVSSSAPSSSIDNKVEFGDLVTMTIVDVFETDCDGKLLSYCPTFDNRNVVKTMQAMERMKKESTKIKAKLNVARKSETGKKVEKTTTEAASMLWRYAGRAATSARQQIGQRINNTTTTNAEYATTISSSPTDKNHRNCGAQSIKDAAAYARALNAAQAATEPNDNNIASETSKKPSRYYISDDDER